MKKNYLFITHLKKLRFILVALVLNLIVKEQVLAQCTFASSFGTATINTAGTVVTISTCSFAGEYSTINGAVNGQTLQFTSSVATDFITIHSGTSNGPVVAFGTTPLNFANTFTGTLYAHWATNAACGTQSACRTTTVQCTSCTPPPPPANDLCTGAININCGQTITGTTVSATVDNVPTCVTALNTAPGVWYTFVGTGQSTTLSLCGSSYDTKIGVFSGTCAALVCVTGNDDFCGLQSSVTFNATLGTTYYVLVTGFGTNSGAFTLARTCVAAIPNDDCTGAINIGCGQTITGTTVGATTDNPPTCVTTLNSAPGLWYSFVGNGATNTLSLCGSGYDTKIGVFTGTCAALVCVTGNDDFCGLQSQVSFATTLGTTYYVIVTGFGTASGAFTLARTSAALPNDVCTGAITINCGQTITGSTACGASADAVPTCTTALNTAPGLWYTFVGDGTSSILSLCGSSYDTKIGVFTGTCAALTCVAGNDDFCGVQSQVTVATTIGTTYYVLVTGFGTNSGNFTLNRTCCGTITRTSALGTDAQFVCTNTAMTNITYATTVATGATVTGLPPGVTGTWAANVFTISGTPTANGIYNYTVTLTGTCAGITATGTITVNNTGNTITLTSAAATTNQTLCSNFPITNITYATTYATGATFSGLPAGVTGAWLANVVTISGTPGVSGTFNYTVTLTGGCGPVVTASGTITVNQSPILNPVGNQVVCNGSLTAPINFSVSTNPVPPPVINWTNNNTTIGLAASGTGNIAPFTAINNGTTPVVATITVTATAGGCTSPVFTFTITVLPNNTITLFGGGGPGTTTFTGQADATDPTTTLRSFRDGVAKTCAAPGTCAAGIAGTFHYDQFSWTNTGSTPQCVSAVYSATNANFSFITAFTAPPTLTNLCNNWLADPGSSALVGTPINWSFNVAGGATVYFLATDVGTLPAGYQLVLNYTNPGGGSNTQTVCQNTPIANIIYNTTGATGATFTGLPPGVTGVWAANVATISGAPTAAGVYNYTVTLTGGCGTVTATGTITVTALPSMDLPLPGNQVLCHGQATAPVNFTTAQPGVYFTWTNSNSSIGLASVGVGNIPSFNVTNTSGVVQVATITVTAQSTLTPCLGVPVTFTITVNPGNTLTLVSSLPGTTTFTGQADATDPTTTLRSFRDGVAKTCAAPGTCTAGIAGTFHYDQFSWTNPSPSPQCVSAVYSATNANFSFITAFTAPPTLTNLCNNWLADPGSSALVGTPINWSFNVAGGATVYFLATDVGTLPAGYQLVLNYNIPTGGSNVQTVCQNTAIAPIIYNTTAATGATFTGLPPGVTGNWAANVATISGTPTVAGVYTYRITLTGGCGLVSDTGRITVNPIATVNGVGNQTLCAGTLTNAVSFTGPVSGTIYNWTNSNTAIGLAASGSGNIPAFTATNATASPISSTITVTPSGPCAGPATSFTITVNPVPTVNAVTSQTLCRGNTTSAVSFTGLIPGTIYNWTNNTPSIGLAAAGTGNIPAFTAVNTTIFPVTATITVTPVISAGCVGTPITFTITVNPGVNVSTVPNPARVCLSDTVLTLNAGPTGGVWTGPGVITGTNRFDPMAAGLGVKVLTYTITAGCGGVANMNITVNDCLERHNTLAYALRMWPNPSNGRFNIQFLSDSYKDFGLKVIDAYGQIVKDFKFTGLIYGQIIPMDLRGLSTGMYILEAYNSQEHGTYRIVIAR